MAAFSRVLRRDERPWFRHPAQVVVFAFAIAIFVGTALLMLPVSRTDGGTAPFMVAFFTATSATCVTGLAVVDTPTYWSTFGELVILGLIQIGGFGIMALASLLGLLVFHRLGLRSRLVAASETKATGLGDVRTVVKGVFAVTVLCEATIAVVLTLRFALGYHEGWGRAAYLGIFHSISAFNNAGFALYSDNLMGFVSDPWICLPIAFAVIGGGLGFPVWIELTRRFRPTWAWSMHTRMTLSVTALLLVLGTIFVTVSEWTNPATLGALSTPDRLLAGFFQAVMPRTAGFNSLDYGQMHNETLLGTDMLMFIGGGSAGTAGGIKVTTFILLFFVILAEVRGEPDATAFGRRLDSRAIRQALAVALLAMGAVVTATLGVLSLSDVNTDDALFEVTSAFATVGLSTGITADLPTGSHLILIVMMFLGRLGPVTLVSALALRDHSHLYRLPEGRPLIG